MSDYVIYARKSTESEDRQALSIDAQLSELREYSAKNDLTIVKVYTESMSAKQAGRPVFGEMLRAVRDKHVTGVLCWKLDRLTRNLADAALMSDLLEAGAIQEIRTPFQVYRNTSTDKFMTGLDFIIAKKYIDELGENVKRGLRMKVKQGWRPGKAPVGYLNAPGDKGNRTLIPDPERFDLVKRMWDLVLSGKYSAAKVVRIANGEWGFRTRQLRRLGGKPLSASMLYDILHDPFYYGHFKYQGDLHSGSHVPMVSRSEFDRVQEILSRKGNTRPKGKEFAFTGIIKCGECGTMVTAEEKSKWIKSEGRIKRYIYYHCTRKRNPLCRQPALSEEGLKAQIDEFLQRIELPKDYLDWAIRNLESVRKDDQRRETKARDSAERELQRIAQRLDNLLALRISPENAGERLISNDEYLRQKDALLREKAALESRLDRSEYLDKEATDLARQTLRFATYARAWFANADLSRQKGILMAIGSNHVLLGGRLLMTAKKPLLVLANSDFRSTSKPSGLEPKERCLKHTQSATLRDGSPPLLRRSEEVRTEIKKILESGEEYRIAV